MCHYHPHAFPRSQPIVTGTCHQGFVSNQGTRNFIFLKKYQYEEIQSYYSKQMSKELFHDR